MLTVPDAEGIGSSIETSLRSTAIFLVDAPDTRRVLDRNPPAHRLRRDADGLVPARVETHILQHGLYTHNRHIPRQMHLHGEN